MFLSKTMITSD